MEAALQEKQVWNAASPADANDALVRKASCYASAELWSDAAATLGRVRMYLLSPEERKALLLSKEMYFYMAGDMDAAAAVDEELGGEESEIHSLVCEALAGRPKSKDATTAMLLSIIPGLGHFYAGAWKEGLLEIGANAAAIAWTVTQIASGCYVSGILGGAIALNWTYLGGIQRAGRAASDPDRRK